MRRSIPIERNPKPFAGQEKAITTLDRNILVSAGAGSGKTWVLTERYLEILSKGFRPSEIVAITFTEKAAGEMKARIRQAVKRMREQAVDEEREFWTQAEQEIKQSMVTTIHGFCSRLLRSHPIEAGLDPYFQVLDGTDAELLIREVFLEACREYMETGESDAVLLYEQFSSLSELVEAALLLYEKMRTYHRTPADILEETRVQVENQKERFHVQLEHLARHVQAMKEEFALCKAAAKKPAAYFDAFESWMSRFDQLYPLLEECNGELTENIQEKYTDLIKNGWRKSGSEALKILTDDLRQRFLPELEDCFHSPQYLDIVQALCSLVEKAAREYKSAKDKMNAVDFSDLESLAVELLSSRPDVAAKWQHRIRFLMVDEFQDTNPLQKKIIDYLTNRGQRVRLFVVGDGKQSIYRFRGADVQVFYQMEEEILRQGGERVSLSMNFRTQSGIISYINSLFAGLMKREEHAPSYNTVYEELEAYRRSASSRSPVEFIITSEQRDGETDVDSSTEEEEQHWVELEADALARRIQQMVLDREQLVWKRNDEGVEIPCPVSYGDIAVLLAARSQMHLYEYIFREYGIPYIVVGGSQFYQKQEILDVINVLKLIHNPEDEIALLGFLRSPFVQLKDTTLFWLSRDQSLKDAFFAGETRPAHLEEAEWEKWLKAKRWMSKWTDEKHWLNVYDLLKEVFEDTGYPLMLLGGYQGEQKLANTEKLMELARARAESKGHGLYGFIQFLERMVREESKEEEASVVEDRGDAVVIMSVHASKGLEFPVVCIPEMRKDVLKKGGGASRIYYQPGQGIGLRLADREQGNGLFKKLKAEEERQEIQEAIRLLYVAMTRARDHLILVCSDSKAKSSWLQWTMGHLEINEFRDFFQPVKISGNGRIEIKLADQLPASTKSQGSQSFTWQYWLQHVDSTNDRRLPEFPLMPKNENYPWNGKQPGQNKAAHLPVLSASSLMLYRRCPRLFYLQHIEGLHGLDDWARSSSQAEAGDRLSASVRGTIVHQLIERVSKKGLAGVDWDQELIYEWECMHPSTSPHQEDLLLMKRHLLAYESFLTACGPGKFEEEKSLYMLWNGQPIHGKIDRIQYHLDGTVSLYDFKTNRVAGSVGKAAESYFLQGYVYTELVERVLGKQVVSMKFVFLDSGDVIELPLDETSRKENRTMAEQLINELQNRVSEEDYPCCRLRHCICKNL